MMEVFFTSHSPSQKRLNMLKTVLVVDDEIANRRLPALILDAAQYRVIECEDGKQAMDILNESSVDYILLDISLPLVNGIDICKSIRQSRKFDNIKIFAYTAHAMRDETQNFLDSGFDNILIKPINRRDLLALFTQ